MKTEIIKMNTEELMKQQREIEEMQKQYREFVGEHQISGNDSEFVKKIEKGRVRAIDGRRASPAVPRGGDVDVRRDDLRRAVEQLARGDGPSFHGNDGTSAVDGVGTRLPRAGARHRVGAAEAQALLLDE